MPLDIRVLDLLASKLCHDLISPVSAINNGVELMVEVGGDVADEAMTLIGNSAQQAARKLRLYRLCYGRAGSEVGVSIKEARQIMQDMLQGSKLTLDWPEPLAEQPLLAQRGAIKTLLNLLILGEEALPYGGSLSVSATARGNIEVAALGRNAGLQPPTQAALLGQALVDDLVPRTVHAYITRVFAQNFNLELTYQALPEQAVFGLSPKQH